MKLGIRQLFNLTSGHARSRKEYWSELRALIQTEQNKDEGLFDENWYQLTYPDVRDAQCDPLKHYILHGAEENRQPGPNFDGGFYSDLYPDVNSTKINPLVHYLRHGKSEGRATKPRMDRVSMSVRHVIVKELKMVPGSEVAVLVTHSGSGRLKPHVLPYIEQLRGAGLTVLLVANVDRPLELLDAEIAGADGVIVRENAGYDFGAWAHGFRLCPTLFGAGLLILTNDSVVPTADKAVFHAMMGRVRKCPADVVGLTANHEDGWHLQSYFLALKPKALASRGFQHFIRNLRRIDDKDDVIRTYEVPFATRMQSSGLIVRALFSATFSANPTIYSWRELIAQGFPFIKLLMLRKQFPLRSDQAAFLDDLHKTWPKVLESAGFDVDLVRAAIRAADLALISAGSNNDLLINAKQYEFISDDHPLRVAYFGPWNYDCELGSVSREVLCALRHTGVQLSAYPIEKTFHVHRPICPAVATVDFNARPDLAIIHLNPDSWHLLTTEQNKIIQQAKCRIGYWSWETGQLPPSLTEYLDMVDRIWVPSVYGAELVTAVSHLPVDVVPYPVRIPVQTFTEVHGKHFAGHRWAKVDEDEPAATLTKVASGIVGGDIAVSTTARETIARKLSYEAVADIINTTLHTVIVDFSGQIDNSSRPEAIAALLTIPEYQVALAKTPRFRQMTQINGVVPAPLADDLSWNSGQVIGGDNDGDWIIFAPGNAHIHPDTIDIILDAAAHRPDVVLFYGDDVASDEKMLDRIRLKPDYNQTLLVAQDYIGAPVIVRRKTLVDIGGINPTRGTAVIYDLVLRVAKAGGSIGRIPQVLIGHDGKRPTANVVDRRSVLADCRPFSDIDIADGAAPGLLVQRRRFEEIGYPAISIVISAGQTCHSGSNQTCIENVLSGIANASWPMNRVTVIVGDDVVGDPGTWERDRWPFQLKRVETLRENEAPFNHAAKMNSLWRVANDEHIVFMNDDVTPGGADWLAALMSFASDESVGGVTGRHYFDDGRLQHAGIIPTAGAVAHAWLGWPSDALTYQDWAMTQREWSMVTGAVFATRRSILCQVNGFDERFGLEFNDLDLCLRIRNMGYRIVYNPDAQFTHREKASCEETIPPGEEVALFLSRWSQWLEKDPAFHPQYIPDRVDIVPAIDTNAWYSG